MLPWTTAFTLGVLIGVAITCMFIYDAIEADLRKRYPKNLCAKCRERFKAKPK